MGVTKNIRIRFTCDKCFVCYGLHVPNGEHQQTYLFENFLRMYMQHRHKWWFDDGYKKKVFCADCRAIEMKEFYESHKHLQGHVFMEDGSVMPDDALEEDVTIPTLDHYGEYLDIGNSAVQDVIQTGDARKFDKRFKKVDTEISYDKVA